MRWMVLILGVFLFGCVVAPYQARYQGPPPMQSTTLAQANAMVGVQQPTAYKVGFMAGCDSGHVSAGNNSFIFKKDVERFGKDDLYQQGWTDGFNRCVSGGGTAAGSSYYSPYYGGYYSGTYYSGYYDPGYYYYPYYSPGFSLWLGNYGHRNHYVHSDHYYYSPWYGGRKHKGSHGVGPYIGNQRGGGHKGGGHKGGGHKGGGHKGGGHKGGGHKGLGGFIR